MNQRQPCLAHLKAATPIGNPHATNFWENPPTNELVLRNVDGSPISSERLSALRILATTNLSLPSAWMPIPNSLELTNGLVRVQGLEANQRLSLLSQRRGPMKKQVVRANAERQWHTFQNMRTDQAVIQLTPPVHSSGAFFRLRSL